MTTLRPEVVTGTQSALGAEIAKLKKGTPWDPGSGVSRDDYLGRIMRQAEANLVAGVGETVARPEPVYHSAAFEEKDDEEIVEGILGDDGDGEGEDLDGDWEEESEDEEQLEGEERLEQTGSRMSIMTGAERAKEKYLRGRGEAETGEILAPVPDGPDLKELDLIKSQREILELQLKQQKVNLKEFRVIRSYFVQTRLDLVTTEPGFLRLTPKEQDERVKERALVMLEVAMIKEQTATVLAIQDRLQLLATLPNRVLRTTFASPAELTVLDQLTESQAAIALVKQVEADGLSLEEVFQAMRDTGNEHLAAMRAKAVADADTKRIAEQGKADGRKARGLAIAEIKKATHGAAIEKTKLKNMELERHAREDEQKKRLEADNRKDIWNDTLRMVGGWLNSGTRGAGNLVGDIPGGGLDRIQEAFEKLGLTAAKTAISLSGGTLVGLVVYELLVALSAPVLWPVSIPLGLAGALGAKAVTDGIEKKMANRGK